MTDKIKVEVFGIKDQPAGAGCSCGGSCGPTKTMKEMYDEFVEYLSKTEINDKVEINFTDILLDSKDEITLVTNAMKLGYKLPLTSLNGKMRFYGGISNELMVREITKLA